ncbi:MAG TPA: hypothetical protein VGT41_01475 [Candidatus Babeliales bacterium]|nr:hypothetical protein [Candidatus Babeliales bacterium]
MKQLISFTISLLLCCAAIITKTISPAVERPPYVDIQVLRKSQKPADELGRQILAAVAANTKEAEQLKEFVLSEHWNPVPAEQKSCILEDHRAKQDARYDAILHPSLSKKTKNTLLTCAYMLACGAAGLYIGVNPYNNQQFGILVSKLKKGLLGK